MVNHYSFSDDIFDRMDIVNINIGQTGINIGDCFWDTLYQQHQLSGQPVGCSSTFFAQTQKEITPRSIQIDMNQAYPQKNSHHQSFKYKEQNIVRSNKSSFGVFGESYYNRDSQFKDDYKDKIRKQLELSDGVGGFLLMSSLGGGTGSGITSDVLQHIRQIAPGKMVQSFKLLPLLDNYCHPIEIYNTAFALNYEIQNTDMTVLFDNQAICKILASEGNLHPSLDLMNQKVGAAIANSTIPFRFKGDLNTSQRKIATSMIPFPRLHFMSFSQNQPKDFNSISSALKSSNHFLSHFQLRKSNIQFFNIYAGVRDSILSEQLAVQEIKRECERKSYQFVQWLPDSIHLSLHEPIKQQRTTMLMNGRYMMGVFKDISEKFSTSFRRKSFIDRYLSVNMDQMYFTEAESNLNDLQSEYGPPCGMDYDEDEDSLDQNASDVQ